MSKGVTAASDAVRYALELADLPTAAGRERRVIAWIERWVAERPGLSLTRDAHGNLTVSIAGAPTDRPSVYLTAHLDHPAFVVERVIGPGTVELAFRGGVMDRYFERARVELHPSEGAAVEGVLVERDGPQEPFKRFVCELDDEAPGATVGDVARWALPAGAVEGGRLRVAICDDLAAAAAALAAMDNVLAKHAAGETIEDLRLLFTRAEEIGFIGAIGASTNNSIPRDARLICLENSRASDDAPIGGGPIVRVGDRISTFSPALTAAIAKRAEEVFGGPATPRATQTNADAGAWQRKLMAGGACEASVFCAHGFEATCVCLPLGNYHNMGELDAVQAGAFEGTAPIMREEVAVSDLDGMVALLTACGTSLPAGGGFNDRLAKLWNDLSGVLD